MVDQPVSQPFCDDFLQRLQLRVDEFDHIAGFDIDQMIVMRLGRGFVPGAPVAEIVPVEDACLFEQADGAVYGGDRNLGVDCRCALMQHFDIGMIGAFGQDAGDDAALVGDAQPALGTQLFQIDALFQYTLSKRNAPLP